eukprot:2173045-Rhodomonas_salina.1
MGFYQPEISLLSSLQRLESVARAAARRGGTAPAPACCEPERLWAGNSIRPGGGLFETKMSPGPGTKPFEQKTGNLIKPHRVLLGDCTVPLFFE